MKKDTPSFSDDIESFLLFQEALGYKRISYEPVLRSAEKYFSEQYEQPVSLTQEVVMDYLDNQIGGISNKASTLRLFAVYLNAIGRDAYVIPKDMYGRHKPDAPYIFSDGELTQLFHEIDHIQPKSSWLSNVAPVMFRLTYTCGLRPKEARELKRVNINFKTGEILIEHSKRKKDRTVVMSEDMLSLCSRFDQQRTIMKVCGEYFFAREDGSPYKGQAIQRLLSVCWNKAASSLRYKNPPRIRVYCLRHRFATAVIHRWIDEGKDLRNKLPYLQAYMGHDRLDETVYYVHLLPENLVQSAGIDWNAFDGLIPEVLP